MSKFKELLSQTKESITTTNVDLHVEHHKLAAEKLLMAHQEKVSSLKVELEKHKQSLVTKPEDTNWFAMYNKLSEQIKTESELVDNIKVRIKELFGESK